MNACGRSGDADRFAKEGRFLGIALNEMNVSGFGVAEKHRQNDSRKTGPGSQIDYTAIALGNEFQELCGVCNVTIPDVFDGRAADQIDAPLPTLQNVRVGNQAIQCFT